MIRRLLVVPAAGSGTRLKRTLPKALVPVAGRPMLDWLGDLYRPWVDRIVVVVNPSFRTPFDAWAERHGNAEVVEQPSPTGMLDAILLARSAVEHFQPQWIWITWCDQIGILPATIARLADQSSRPDQPAMVLSTVAVPNPYIHFSRGPDGRVSGVLQRREGDVMPAHGESDMGLFALARGAFTEDLVRYADVVSRADTSGERNFLPFIPWLAARDRVVTFPGTDPREAVGINTPEDLLAVEAWLRTAGGQ